MLEILEKFKAVQQEMIDYIVQKADENSFFSHNHGLDMAKFEINVHNYVGVSSQHGLVDFNSNFTNLSGVDAGILEEVMDALERTIQPTRIPAYVVGQLYHEKELRFSVHNRKEEIELEEFGHENRIGSSGIQLIDEVENSATFIYDSYSDSKGAYFKCVYKCV